MVDLQAAAETETHVEGAILFGGAMPTRVAVPTFFATADNPHPSVAVDGAYRPIDITIPWPEDDDFFERWTDASHDAFDVTIGAQTGTGVLGEKFGRRYRSFHIRGIDVPANSRLTEMTVELNNGATPPVYASAGDGYAQFTGDNAPWFHVGGGITTITNWTQEEALPGRHKWSGHVFDSPSGITWKCRAYTWPGIERTELVAFACWHDQRTTDTWRLIPELYVSVPTLTHECDCDFAAQRKIAYGGTKVVGSDIRSIIRVTPVAGQQFNDAQRIPFRMSMIPKAAAIAERNDWRASMAWPCKGTADPTFWDYRIGPYSVLREHPGYWNVSSQWGDGGGILRNELFDNADVNFGFRALMEQRSAAQYTYASQGPRSGHADSREASRRNSYGNSFLSCILGIRYGNPRTLIDFAYSAYWDSMRPNSYIYWTGGAPSDRWIGPNDYLVGARTGGLNLKAQRVHTAITKNVPGMIGLGSSLSPVTQDEVFYPSRGIASLSGYEPSHHEMTIFGTLAILDDIRDHWQDTLEVNAGCYVYENEKSLDGAEDDWNSVIGSPGQYRTGRVEMGLSWALEVVDATTHTTILQHIVDRFERHRKPYWEFWGHIKAKHGWRTWAASYSNALNRGQLLVLYHAIWEQARGLPGYAAIARYVRRYAGRGHVTEFAAEQGKFHIAYGWSDVSGAFEPFYRLHYPGLRLVDQDDNQSGYVDPENYGDAPDLTATNDPTLFTVDTGTEREWWLGCVQESYRLAVSEYPDDTDLQDRALAIEARLALQIAQHTSPFYSVQEIAYACDAEHHSAADFPALADTLLVVPAEVEQTTEHTETIDQNTTITLNVGAEDEAGDEESGSIDQAQPHQLFVLVEQEVTEVETGMIGQARNLAVAAEDVAGTEGALLLQQGDDQFLRVFVEQEVTEPEGEIVVQVQKLAVAVEEEVLEVETGHIDGTAMMVAAEDETHTEGVLTVIGGGTESPTYHGSSGTWQPEIAARGGWQKMATSSGITITAGDAEVIRVTIVDENKARVDCTAASAAEFALVVPSTPYRTERVLLRRSLANGVSCATGDPVIQLGDTSSLGAEGQAIWSLRVTLGAQTQTVARAPARIIANPVPDDLDGVAVVDLA